MKTALIIAVLFTAQLTTAQLTTAQILYSENFNNFSLGNVGTDYSGTTPGQGGWYTKTNAIDPNYNGMNDYKIVTEPGRGNVLEITSPFEPTKLGNRNSMAYKKGIEALWNNRTVGNNVLKFEYECFGTNNFGMGGNVISQGQTLINSSFNLGLKKIMVTYWDTTFKTTVLKNYSSTDPFPENMWIKSEIFVDYNTKKIYFYIPTLNLYTTGTFSHNRMSDNINIIINSLNTTSVVKIDNIKLTALSTVPPEVVALSVNKQLATKFNLYPNPATNVVNITNEENMQVNQITVYTLAGKQVSTQAYNNQTEIQLNVEHLASGTYLLYLQTAQGTAVKQLIKK